MATRGRGGRKKLQSGFGKSAVEVPETGVPTALIRQARHSGQLNLSNRNLSEVPHEVWRINIDVPEEGKDDSLDTGPGNRWWEQTDLTKLILASNQLKDISPDIVNLPALAVLDIHDNKLTSLPDEIGQLQQLWKFNLSHNKLSSLPKALVSVTGLKVILLSGNIIEQLPENFGSLINLEELDLSDNKISCLPESIGNLSKLKKLNLANNQLKELPYNMRKMTGLRDLCLRNNKLTMMPSGLENMSSIDIIDCGTNLITEFPPINGPVNLKELYLGNNRLQHLDPEMFKFLSLLVTLDVKDNTIQSIPDSIILLKKLQRFDMKNNCVSCLPFLMGNMDALTSVALDGNPLKGIRRDVISKGTQSVLKYLKTRIVTVDKNQDTNTGLSANTKNLEINDNHLTSANDIDVHKITSTRRIEFCNKKVSSIPQEYFLKDVAISTIDFSNNILSQVPSNITTYASSLTELDLKCNKLTDIPKELSSLCKLKFLDLGSNMISSIPPECKSWQSLNQIILSSNRFQLVPEFLYEIKSLEVLLASSNQITSIDVTGLLKLPQLGSLDLSNNNISNVPPELGNVTSLKSLNIEGNAFRNPRHAVLLKGTNYILEYLKDRIPR